MGTDCLKQIQFQVSCKKKKNILLFCIIHVVRPYFFTSRTIALKSNGELLF